ncbi:fungal-specific transcription factor domain-containing protein [Aspergillus ambiguus]|uniref:fungal specific transcription factor domain-containing protein n=1 Tax=Aspergillus ambiguus TaxID=176160 RepID=UPI003CCE4C85
MAEAGHPRPPGREIGSSQETGQTQNPACKSSQDEINTVFRQNPLVDTDYTFAKSPDGRYWYMGPSSSWSFCRRVLALIGKHMPDCPPDPWNADGGVYKMQWTPLGPDDPPDITNLPPLDYALFLFNSVKFHFGPLFYLINEPEYLRNLHEFYENITVKASTARLWYAQYLLILAFGKAFTGHIVLPGNPAGCQYATRAMGLLPGLGGLNDDSLLSVQVLTLAAVYFQAIDMRVAAFQHIGQAIRICVLEGMHRHMPEDVLGAEYSRRCHITFWVVYMLERELSAVLGAPSSIRDEDITVPLPSETSSSLDSWNMTLHVRLSRLTAQILTTIYGVHQATDGSLIKNTQSILRNLADLSQDLKHLLDTHFQGSVSKASRIAIRLILSYHRCVVVTTRPLVMCALHMHISQAGPNSSRKVCLSPAVASLIQSGVDSARNILRILRVLGDEDLMEAFLPFQLEDAFSSAFVLQLIRAVAPWLLPDETWGDDVESVLDRMISKGNVVAPLRKVELSQLAHIMTPLTPNELHFQSPSPSREPPGNEHPTVFSTEEEPSWDLFIGNTIVGLDPGEILDLAAQLDVGPGMYSMES